MRKYGNNMKCAFVSVLMNLINGGGTARNSFPSKSRRRGKKKKRFIAARSQPRHCSCSPILRRILGKHVYQLAQSVCEMPWDSTREFQLSWRFTWMIMESGKYFCYQKKCGDINPFHGRSPTPLLSLEHLTLMIQSLVGFSIHDASSFPPVTLTPAGRGRLHHRLSQSWNLELSLLKQEHYEATHLQGPFLVLKSFGRWMDWMMTMTFPADIVIR